MAYSTGQLASIADLKTQIETLCQANGWTLSGSGWLSKGQSNIRLTAVNASVLTVSGARTNSGDSTCPYIRAIRIQSGWPITYHFFCHQDPDQVVIVLHYSSLVIQTIMFGDIVKTHDNAYVGGNWFYASGPASTDNTLLDLHYGYYGWLINWDDENSSNGNPRVHGQVGGHPPYGGLIPFIGQRAVDSSGFVNYCPVYAEIDGNTWSGGVSSRQVRFSSSTVRLMRNSPSAWNQQALLVPMWLDWANPSGTIMPLGYIEHIRLVRITNYQINDLIVLGTDKWRVYPWNQKNSSFPNGPGSSVGIDSTHQTTGTIGFAVRYDGP